MRNVWVVATLGLGWGAASSSASSLAESVFVWASWSCWTSSVLGARATLTAWAIRSLSGSSGIASMPSTARRVASTGNVPSGALTVTVAPTTSWLPSNAGMADPDSGSDSVTAPFASVVCKTSSGPTLCDDPCTCNSVSASANAGAGTMLSSITIEMSMEKTLVTRFCFMALNPIAETSLGLLGQLYSAK